jgi:hypothetical protein
MELRHHPFLSFGGNSSWPPVWKWKQGPKMKELPRKEIGVLKDVRRSGLLDPEYRLFLTVEHKGNEYVGTVTLHDGEFHRQLNALLLEHVGESVAKIGGLDVSHLSKTIHDASLVDVSQGLKRDQKVGMKQIYKEHRIQSLPKRLPDSNRWTAYVVIHWTSGSSQNSREFDIRQGFATEEEASKAALQFGEKWIDDGKPRLR